MKTQHQELKIYNDITQGTQEWQDLRLGKITGSGFKALMGTPAAREKYLYDLVSEIVTGYKCDGAEFTNSHMERGHRVEHIARAEYAARNFVEVKEAGFVELDQYVGCSPDGLVGNDGLIEIKAPDSNNYLKMLIDLTQNNIVQKEHMYQMQFNMYVTNRLWCDYILYNEKHEAANNMGFYAHRVKRDESMQKTIEGTIVLAVKTIEDNKKTYYDIFKKLQQSETMN